MAQIFLSVSLHAAFTGKNVCATIEEILSCTESFYFNHHFVLTSFSGVFMFQNYFKIALRAALRQKLYSILNIAGLAIGIGAALLIILFVHDELLYDKFLPNADKIYRAAVIRGDNNEPKNANGSLFVSPALQRDIPEIAYSTRFFKIGWGEKCLLTNGDKGFYEEHFYFADSTTFSVFPFPFLAGNPRTALIEPNTAVITAGIARKYFGTEDALGKTLTADPYKNGKVLNLKITGVIKDDFMTRTHLKFDCLASFSSQADSSLPMKSLLEACYTYVLLKDNVSASAVQAKFPAMLKNMFKLAPNVKIKYGLHLQPIADIHLRSHLNGEPEPNGDINTLYIFAAIGVFIVLIACINFMNMATARSAQRSREVGVRKVLGAPRLELMRQFLAEALLFSTLATLCALGLVEAALPAFNAMMGKALTGAALREPMIMFGIVALTLGVGVIAGAYPAFFLSSFEPVVALKGKSGATRTASVLRKGLVITQFTISTALIVCTAVAYKQMEFIRTKQLGFDREHILVLPMNSSIATRMDAFKQVAMKNAGILSITASEQVPAKAGNGAGYKFEGRAEPDGMYRLFTDGNFLRTYGIELVAGRDFSEKLGTDSTQAFIVNEKILGELGWKSPQEAIGKGITMEHAAMTRRGAIIGVVKDFHIFSLHEKIEGMVINIMPMEKMNFISIRIASDENRETLEYLRNVWKSFAPAHPFDYYALDDDFSRLHKSDEEMGLTFRYFALLAVVVACLGLFGLAAFTAERRTKEIAVRKVLGASMFGITTLLGKEFFVLVGVSFLLACPLGYFVMNKWLQDFAYRITIGVDVLIIAGVAAFAAALTAILWQTLRAARANPVKALKCE